MDDGVRVEDGDNVSDGDVVGDSVEDSVGVLDIVDEGV